MTERVDASLIDGCRQLALDPSPEQLTLLDRYLDLLEKWNRVYNLSAIRERANMVTHHVLDSLAVLPYLQGRRLLDVGSGAGLPGLPIAIIDPSYEVTVLDSNHKKAAFLRQAVAELGLSNAAVSSERVETWQPAKRFELIISRAFAELGEFAANTKHLLLPCGSMVAMKGLHPYEEIERLPAGIKLDEVRRLTVPGLHAERHLVFLSLA